NGPANPCLVLQPSHQQFMLNSIKFQLMGEIVDQGHKHSLREYYLKLEELKNAHLETMTKLEHMYQNKLYLRGVQPLVSKEVVARISNSNSSLLFSFKNSRNMHKSFSEPELHNSFYSRLSDVSDKESSEEEEEEKEEENATEVGSVTFAKEQIENMWTGFSVEDYTQTIKHRLPKSPAWKKTRRKKKEWSPKVTMPEPFQMTIREAKKKQQNVKSKSQIELENSLLKKQLEEEAECQKKFRANPVPAYVFLPLYHEIMERNEERRRFVKERCRDILLASQQPFQFIEREEQRKEIRKMQVKDLSASQEQTKVFKAKPVPKFVYSQAINDKLKEEELYREIRIQMRAEELLHNSSLPKSKLASRDANRWRKQKCIGQSEELEHKPRIKSKVPDFETLHQRFQERLLKQKHVKHITVCEPFNLRTPCIPSNKGKILEDIQADEEKLKETRWPYASPRCKPQTRCLSAHSSPLVYEQSRTPRITESTRRRLQAIRSSLEERKTLEEEKKRSKAKQKERAIKLRKLITTRAEANDPHRSLAQMSKSKLKLYRKYEKQRLQEYLKELEEMEERVKWRPLLLERATQKNARMAAEKHYSALLKEVGLCEEFVSKKGRAAKLLDRPPDGSESPAEDRESDEEEEKAEHQSDQSGDEEQKKAETQSDQSGHEDEEEKTETQSDQSGEEEEKEKIEHQSDQSGGEEEEKAKLQTGQSCEKGEEEFEHGEQGAFEYEDEDDESEENSSSDEAD
uniref:Protein FAM161A n=1 Tax=Sphenodon punctatus TaxID=8508 RepID=A0A8D0H1F9_SPHPU